MEDIKIKSVMKTLDGGSEVTETTFQNGEIEFENSSEPGPNAVIPNPELEGDEPDLEGLQVGNSKFAIPLGNIDAFKLPVIENFNPEDESTFPSVEVWNTIKGKVFSNTEHEIFYPISNRSNYIRYIQFFGLTNDEFTIRTFDVEVVDNELSIECYGETFINNVFPNPTLEGTEDILTGLQIGNSKYKICNIPAEMRYEWFFENLELSYQDAEDTFKYCFPFITFKTNVSFSQEEISNLPNLIVSAIGHIYPSSNDGHGQITSMCYDTSDTYKLVTIRVSGNNQLELYDIASGTSLSTNNWQLYTTTGYVLDLQTGNKISFDW